MAHVIINPQGKPYTSEQLGVVVYPAAPATPTYSEGIDWLAQNTDNSVPATDAIRLLAYLTDTAEEWILQEVGYRQTAIAANDRKTQADHEILVEEVA